MVLKNWAFVHGLASLISSKVIDLPDERIATLLSEAGAGLLPFRGISKATKEGKND